MKKKIIGTGLTGLVGSRIVELLAGQYDFVNLSLSSGTDILDSAALEKAFEENPGAETVLHLAAFTDTNAAWEQRGDKTGLCYRINVEGTRNVASLCQKYGKHLVYFSTDFVFDGEKEAPYIEEDIPHPIEWYGETKYWGEEEVKKSAASFTILRIAYPFRAKFEKKKDLIRKIIDGFKNNSLYPMFSDQITTPTFIDDIALGVKYFLEEKTPGIFHLVASSFQSPYQMSLEIAQVFGFDQGLVRKGSLAEYLQSQPPGSRPWQRKLAISNAKVTKLGIKMKTLKEALLEVKKQIKKQ